MRARQMMGEVGAAERDSEQEAQGGGLAVQLRWLGSLFDLMLLETPEITTRGGVGGTAEEGAQRLDMIDIVLPGLVAERTDGHVRQHAAVQIVDGLVGHRSLLGSGLQTLRSSGPKPVLLRESSYLMAP
jgi:hypothetical protein